MSERSGPGGIYLRESGTPLASLLLLLPLIAIYEIGSELFARRGGEQQVIAFLLLRQFFGWFGANGRHLPAFAVIAVLLSWHIARKDPWRISLQTLAGMALESIAIAMPLVVLGRILPHYFPLAGAAGEHRVHLAVLSLGAGIYEELIFRLLLFTVLSLLLRDILGLKGRTSAILTLLVSALLFSAYHYLSPHESFRMGSFTFRTVAGIYFGGVFLARGFGITASSHAAYDILVIVLTSGRI